MSKFRARNGTCPYRAFLLNFPHIGESRDTMRFEYLGILADHQAKSHLQHVRKKQSIHPVANLLSGPLPSSNLQYLQYHFQDISHCRRYLLESWCCNVLYMRGSWLTGDVTTMTCNDVLFRRAGIQTVP